MNILQKSEEVNLPTHELDGLTQEKRKEALKIVDDLLFRFEGCCF